MTMKNTIRAAALSVAALFTQATPASAAYYTGVYYDYLANYYEAGKAYSDWDAEAGVSWNALSSTSMPAANAAYYQCKSNAGVKYYENTANFYFNYYLYLAYLNIGSAVSYYTTGLESYEAWMEAAHDHFTAYSTYASVYNYGGDAGDWAAYYDRFSDIIYNISSGIKVHVGSQFAGSYYQTSMLYSGVAWGIQGYYTDLANYYYWTFADLGNFTSASDYYNFYSKYASEASGAWHWTARIYRDFAIANE